MKFYHGTTIESWKAIQKSGYIFSKNKKVYTSTKFNVAKSFGDIVLEIEVDNNTIKDDIKKGNIYRKKGYKDYIFYEKIPIGLVVKVYK